MEFFVRNLDIQVSSWGKKERDRGGINWYKESLNKLFEKYDKYICVVVI